MGRGSIPEPNEHDRDDAIRIVNLAHQGTRGADGAIAIIAQQVAEIRWLRSIIHNLPTEENDNGTT